MASSIWGKFMAASAAAYAAFKRTYSDPQAEGSRAEWTTRQSHYAHLWALYTNSKYDELSKWASYKSRYGLYRYIRNIYNPARRLVDFYAGAIYPGPLNLSGEPPADDQGEAIPLGEETPPELRAAIAQIWQWSNWGANKSLIARWGAALGNVGIEVVDDLEGGKVRLEPIWPGNIEDLEIDAVGHVKRYAVEYEIQDPTGEKEAVLYRREVDGDVIRTYRDRAPYGYDGQPEAYANPYGFAPMVWIPHTYTGSIFGEPAIRSISKLDELNGLVSIALDRLNAVLASPILLAGGGSIGRATGGSKSASTHDLPDPFSQRDRIPVLQGPPESEIRQITPEGLEETALLIDRITREIEQDHPELSMYQELRAMSHVTGPGAERMLGDAANLIQDARTNYDAHSTKLFQMATAIAGWRASSGAWGDLDRQQAKFTPYDLESWQRGDLDVEIDARPVVPQTPRERLELERLRLAVERDRAAGASSAGIEARILAQVEG